MSSYDAGWRQQTSPEIRNGLTMPDPTEGDSERGLTRTPTSSRERATDPSDRALDRSGTSTRTPDVGTVSPTATSSRSQDRQAAPKPDVDTLYFFDGNEDEIAIRAAKKSAEAFYRTQGKPISKWTDLATEIAKYRRVRRLIVDSHGSPGELYLVAEERSLPLDDIANVFSDKRPEQIDELYFEACNVGQQMEDVVRFARFMHVLSVGAWTRFRVLKANEVEVLQGDNGEAIKSRIAQNYGNGWLFYVLPQTDFDSLAKTPGTGIFWTEWWHVHAAEQLPPGDVDPKIFSRRQDSFATNRIRPDEVSAIVREGEKFSWDLVPWHRLIVDLSSTAKP
jgi:hypothetical protein